MTLSLTLGAALLVGVAGGSAAAATTSTAGKSAGAGSAGEHATTAGSAGGNFTTTGSADGNATAAGSAGGSAAAAAQLGTGPLSSSGTVGGVPASPPQEVGAETLGDSDLAPARWQPRAAPASSGKRDGISAVAARQKARPVSRRIGAAGAAWVHPNPTAAVTSCFGPRWGRQHEGVDLAAPHGSPIVAAGAGVIVRAGEEGGYGIAVLIDHGNGYLTHYGHLSAVGVRAGQRVAAGEQIGDEGSTGHSTGPHLHFEVHRGFYQNPVEPTLWMHQHGVDIAGCDAF